MSDMENSAEKELHRLTGELRAISEKVEDPTQKGALEKAGMALNFIFLRGMWIEFEEWYRQKGLPLTDTQRARLVELGIEPDDSGR